MSPILQVPGAPLLITLYDVIVVVVRARKKKQHKSEYNIVLCDA
jgi:hypothetical protein